MQRQFLKHGFGPFYDEQSRLLILGSFPSVKSREQGFYYGHPQNRFWPVMAKLFGEKTPKTLAEKQDLLRRNHIALYDVIESCSIVGSSDSSIADVEAASLDAIIQSSRIGTRIFTNGATADALYRKHQFPLLQIEARKLPSTSPANAAWSLPRLIETWRNALAEAGVLFSEGRDD